jgi:hypothetical protein
MKFHVKPSARKTVPFFIFAWMVISFSAPDCAVSEAAILSLLISLSPQANAMGGAYGNTIDASPMASTMNPASLGMFVRKNNFGTE